MQHGMKLYKNPSFSVKKSFDMNKKQQKRALKNGIKCCKINKVKIGHIY